MSSDVDFLSIVDPVPPRKQRRPGPRIAAQGECEGARYWFPCWDFPSDRATSEIRVSCLVASKYTELAVRARARAVLSTETCTAELLTGEGDVIGRTSVSPWGDRLQLS